MDIFKTSKTSFCAFLSIDINESYTAIIVSYSFIKISQIPLKSFFMAYSFDSWAWGLIVFSIKSKTFKIFDSSKSFVLSVESVS